MELALLASPDGARSAATDALDLVAHQLAADRVRGLWLGRSSTPDMFRTASPIQMELASETGRLAADQSTAM